MAEEDRARIHLPHEIEQVIAIRVGGKIEILDFALASHFTGNGTEQESFAGLRFLQTAAGSFRIGITHEKDRVLRMADHASGEFMRGRFLSHHAGGDDEYLSAAKLHLINLALFENNQI